MGSFVKCNFEAFINFDEIFCVAVYYLKDTVAALREEISKKELNISELKSSMKQVRVNRLKLAFRARATL